MTESAPSRRMIYDEMERARNEFHALLQHASSADLARATIGTRWTNRELLFHMLFGSPAWILSPRHVPGSLTT